MEKHLQGALLYVHSAQAAELLSVCDTWQQMRLEIRVRTEALQAAWRVGGHNVNHIFYCFQNRAARRLWQPVLPVQPFPIGRGPIGTLHRIDNHT
jgi:hypothetical protein